MKVHRSTESVILEVFLFFCACLLFCWQLYSHISPLPHPMSHPYYLLAHHSACPLSQVTIIWKGFHLCIGDSPSLSWAWWRHLRLTRGSPDSICLRALRACRHLYHAPPRPHTSPRTHTTPLHATTLHSHLLPAHTAAPHSHLYFGYKLLVWHVPLGLASVAAEDRATLHIHSTHSINTRKHPTPTPLGKVHKGFLVVPSSSPHQRAFVYGACSGTAQVRVFFLSTLYMV